MTAYLPVIPYNSMTVLHFTHVTYINVILSDLPVIGYTDDRHCAGHPMGKKGYSSLWRLPAQKFPGQWNTASRWGLGVRGFTPGKFFEIQLHKGVFLHSDC